MTFSELNNYKFGFRTNSKSLFKSAKGLTKQLIKDISKRKNEPDWMLKYRLEAFEIFNKKPLPDWGGDLSGIDFDDYHYYLKPQDRIKTNWEDVNPEIRCTFDKLGVRKAEEEFLGGSGAQFESEIVYHSLQKELVSKGVIFESSDSALQNHPELFKKYFGTVVPIDDNKFSALNCAVWSGGSFLYVPKAVKVELPLQAYFRINAKNMGQFERTLIVLEEGAEVHYIEGCTAPTRASKSLHAAVVEVIAKKGARVRYTTLQNWSRSVYNLVTKRARAHEEAEIFWLDCNVGSRLTMKYPAVFLEGKGAKAEIHSLVFAGKGQHQDAGSKIFHRASNTSSKIVSKSISKDGGVSTYRGVLKVDKGCENVTSHVSCNALIMDEKSKSDTYPLMQVEVDNVAIAHEATVSKIGEEQLFYLMSRGLSEEDAYSAIVNGFAEPIVKKLPMEYAVELNRLLELEIS